MLGTSRGGGDVKRIVDAMQARGCPFPPGGGACCVCVFFQGERAEGRVCDEERAWGAGHGHQRAVCAGRQRHARGGAVHLRGDQPAGLRVRGGGRAKDD